MNTNPYRLAGWSAFLLALVTIFTMITASIGLTVGWDKVGLPTDIASIAMYFLNILVLLGLDKFLHPRPIQLWIGILAALVIGVLQILFVSRIVGLEATLAPGYVCSSVVAFVYLVYNWQARGSQSLPNGLTLIGIIGNAGGTVAGVSSFLAQDHPLVWIGGSIYVLNVVWLFWMSRIWLRGNA
ncbi:MAG: hypothetical protein HYZ24_08805 [Chloroflexi bacterium]|nr:hypothetical protein [Chloroflexota bacterium]